MVLVTHDMVSMRSLCDEAILIHDGLIAQSGDPDEVARHYFQLNFAESGSVNGGGARAVEPGVVGRIADVWLEDDAGRRNPEGFEHGGRIHLRARLVADHDIPKPVFSFDICVKDGTRVFSTPLDPVAGDRELLTAGEVVEYSADVVNTLKPGSYVVNCSFSKNEKAFDFVDLRRPVAELVVWGDRQLGLVEMEWRSQAKPSAPADVAGTKG